jgi:hypothetical protein
MPVIPRGKCRNKFGMTAAPTEQAGRLRSDWMPVIPRGRCRNKFGMTATPGGGKPLDEVCFGVGNPFYDPGEIELGVDPETSSA